MIKHEDLMNAWRKVEDGELPPRGKKVLITVRGHVFGGVFNGGPNGMFASESGTQYVAGPRGVTAWQPMPLSPEALERVAEEQAKAKPSKTQ